MPDNPQPPDDVPAYLEDEWQREANRHYASPRYPSTVPYVPLNEKVSSGSCDQAVRYDVVDWDGDLDSFKRRLIENAVFGDKRECLEKMFATVGNQHCEVVEMMIVPMASVVAIDLDSVRNEHNDKVERNKKYAAEVKERAEYERLSRKFGPKPGA